MEDIGFQGKQLTWANNWEDEGYIRVRLDRFFGASNWLMEHSKAVMKHIERQAFDHNLLILDTKPEQRRRKIRFYFDKRWVKKPKVEELIRNTWETNCEGRLMYKVATKIKRCRLELLKWNRQQQGNAARKIQRIQEEMKNLNEQGGQKD